MKHKALSLVAALQLALFGSLAHADVIFQLSDPDICTNLAGTWTGEGHIAASLGVLGTLHCTYRGNVNVTKSAAGYDMAVTLHKESGSLSCPASESMNLPGTCNNGKLLVSTSQASLHGNVDNPEKVSMAGTVTFKVPVTGKSITATVTDMTLQKS